MSRRPSVASLSSIGSGLMRPLQLPSASDSGLRQKRTFSNASFLVPSRRASLNVNLDAIVERSADGWEPDDLFTKHTISEVKAIQQRLRADADAKQEELRLMVGERYRDLLQASTSIISIAQASDNVLNALDEVRNVTSSLRPSESAQISADGQGDEHLQTLQSLAAHLKLLLDAPEHLWRFMERKLYLHAAWLFLLSRVVHRSLLREDEDDDTTWHTLNIHISEQFPIVQRQWDAVSQFRAQISHKATMALRECSATTPEVCAILLTLHLLESRPLPETLATFLAQRTRSLTQALNRPRDRSVNGRAPEASSSTRREGSKTRKVVIREARQKLKAVLDVLVKTMGTSRAIFLQQADGECLPLMAGVLRYVQGDDDAAEQTLPPEVRLSSQTLLTSLPASNHFLLLPATVRSYRPYVDDSSLQTTTEQPFRSKLEEWFRKALRHLETAMGAWFAELSTIRDLWYIREWCRKWVGSANGLDEREVEEFSEVLDNVCSQQATKIWKGVLHSTEHAFSERLASAVQTICQPSGSDCSDAQSVQYLFDVATLPSSTQATTNSSTSGLSFQAYKRVLQRQLSGRSPLLDDVLNTIEKSIETLREDLETMDEHSDDTRGLTSELAKDYGSDAQALCSSICRTLQSAIENLSDDSDSHVRGVVFLGRVADHLSTSSLFKQTIGCSSNALRDFSATLKALYDLTLDRWQKYTISRVISTQWKSSLPPSDQPSTNGVSPHFSKPSSRLLDSLLTLASAIQALGIYADAARVNTLTQQTLHQFVVALVQHLDPGLQNHSAETFGDAAFLYLLVEAWDPDMQETRSMLLSSLLRLSDQGLPPHVREELADWLSRLQVLLGVLLPPRKPSTVKADQGKPSNLLHLGLPTVDAQYQPAFELVKPSARFGLLLVGSSVAR